MNWSAFMDQGLWTVAGVILAAGSSVVPYFRVRRSMRDHLESVEKLTAKLDTALGDIEKLKGHIHELESCRSGLQDSTTQQPALYAFHRGHVLRLHRRGESPSDIASTLGVSQGEVKLIIRLQELTQGGMPPEENKFSL